MSPHSPAGIRHFQRPERGSVRAEKLRLCRENGLEAAFEALKDSVPACISHTHTHNHSHPHTHDAITLSAPLPAPFSPFSRSLRQRETPFHRLPETLGRWEGGGANMAALPRVFFYPLVPTLGQ